ncbi:gamma type small acid-soluble spore protein [Lysinibacillus sp. RC79]
MNNNNQNFNQKNPNAMNSMNEEFGNETDVNQIRQQIQQAEANKKQASGQFANKNSTK